MMSALSPALNPAPDTSAVPTPTAATPAADGSDSSPFSALIQGLQPAAGSTATHLPGAGTEADVGAGAAAAVTAQPLPASLAAPVLPDTADPLTSALTSVLQALGLSQGSSGPALASQDDTDTDMSGNTDATDAESAANTATILPAVPLQVANAVPALPTPVLPAESTPASVTTQAGGPPDTQLAFAASPAQVQARQWLAALAPALVANDSSAANLPDSNALTQQAPVPQAPAAQAVPIASALPAGMVWQSPPMASFFNMTANTESSPVISDRIGLTPDSTALQADAPKGLPSAINFAQTLSNSSSSASTPVLSTLLPHAVQDPGWSDALGQRVAMLAQQGTQSATLQLNPPDLGPIQVRIAMSEQGAKVEFTTLQQTTSDLIETAMPRLAAALEHQGLRLDDSRVNLVNSRQDVFSASSAFSSTRQDNAQGDRGQAAQQQSQHAARLPSATSMNAEPETGRLSGTVINVPVAQKTGIDYYA